MLSVMESHLVTALQEVVPFNRLRFTIIPNLLHTPNLLLFSLLVEGGSEAPIAIIPTCNQTNRKVL